MSRGIETDQITRRRFIVSGAVQGVGFRPFVYRLACELGLSGSVSNNSAGVKVEVQGGSSRIDTFGYRLKKELPPLARIDSVSSQPIPVTTDSGFVIATSDGSGSKSALLLPDMATCPDCVEEVFDPKNRRYRYPFTNCTNCGPRFSIIESLPYDRANTTMKKFRMCPACQAEYEDPSNRRFHAQPNACPDCGPHLELWATDGDVLAARHESLQIAVDRIIAGEIIALKGLGGFQLLVDAANSDSVAELRRRKRRSNKPFALMYPTFESIASDCIVDQAERELILSHEAPIVLVKKRREIDRIAAEVAPDNPYLGVMLPYTPLHRLLMRLFDKPVVATSGNLSEEPLCIDEHEALTRLKGIADVFLVHDRPIKRHVDDSVARVICRTKQIIRRARGYAPMPVQFGDDSKDVIAVGAHLKNAVAIGKGYQIFLSQHIGDLESEQSQLAFRASAQDLPDLYELKPAVVAHDLHPDYSSTIYATNLNITTVGIQHHYAHVLACMADNHVQAPALGVSWDGTGLGLDGNIWGGEFLAVDSLTFSRFAHLRPFLLPGGEIAIKEPRRSAAGLLYEINPDSFENWHKQLPENSFIESEASLIWQMLEKKINSPTTTSMGRLFDAVAAIAGINHKITFEGEAAMQLEFAVPDELDASTYRFDLEYRDNRYEIDWRPMIKAILADRSMSVPLPVIAAKFHNTLVEMIIAVAYRARLRRVCLTGGCLLNRYLTERAVARLRATGFEPYWHHEIPPNDGGISAGQIAAVARMKAE